MKQGYLKVIRWRSYSPSTDYSRYISIEFHYLLEKIEWSYKYLYLPTSEHTVPIGGLSADYWHVTEKRYISRLPDDRIWLAQIRKQIPPSRFGSTGRAVRLHADRVSEKDIKLLRRQNDSWPRSRLEFICWLR